MQRAVHPGGCPSYSGSWSDRSSSRPPRPMTARLALWFVLWFAVPVHAGTVGVVVTGDSELQATLSRQLEGWLRAHGHTIGDPPPPDAISSLLNCMVID